CASAAEVADAASITVARAAASSADAAERSEANRPDAIAASAAFADDGDPTEANRAFVLPAAARPVADEPEAPRPVRLAQTFSHQAADDVRGVVSDRGSAAEDRSEMRPLEMTHRLEQTASPRCLFRLLTSQVRIWVRTQALNRVDPGASERA